MVFIFKTGSFIRNFCLAHLFRKGRYVVLPVSPGITVKQFQGRESTVFVAQIFRPSISVIC